MNEIEAYKERLKILCLLIRDMQDRVARSKQLDLCYFLFCMTLMICVYYNELCNMCVLTNILLLFHCPLIKVAVLAWGQGRPGLPTVIIKVGVSVFLCDFKEFKIKIYKCIYFSTATTHLVFLYSHIWNTMWYNIVHDHNISCNTQYSIL